MSGSLAKSRVASWRPTAVAGGAISAGFTVHMTVALEGAFDFVRFIYENDSTTLTMNIDAVIAAPSAKLGNLYDPVYADGSAVTWSPVYFNNAGAAGNIPAPAGSTAAIAAIAATADATIPTKAYTDWTALASLDRADLGEVAPLLMMRTLTGAANTFRTVRQAAIQTAWRDPTLSFGRILREAQKGANHVTTNTAGFSGAAPVEGDYIAPVSIQYLARALGGTVMGVGDSLTASHSTAAGNMGGMGFLACVANSTPLRPVQWHCEAYPGLTSAQYYARGVAAIPVIKPAVVLIQTMSGNEANATTAVVEAAWQRALTMAEVARQNGGVPILITPYPRSYGATAEGLRQGICARLRAMAQSGSVLVLDADEVLRNPANPSVIRADINQDNTHTTYQGERLLAQRLAPLVSRALLAAA